MTAATTTDSHSTSKPYAAYWFAWLILLFITLAMVFIGSKTVLLAGIMVKATIISLWFMHLRYEVRAFTWIIALSLLLTGAILFVLIAPDGMAM